jgi:putative hydrolase of the HAD superfamily
VKYAAAIFDLFGTLVDNLPRGSSYDQVLTDMAAVLAVTADAFHDLWHGLAKERMTGALHSPDDVIDHICQTLGTRPEESQRRQAIEMKHRQMRQQLVLRPDAVAVLERLKADGYGTALVSDCSDEVPALWDGLALARLIDVPIFSCVAGLMKPDPRIYRLAAEGLGIEPTDCLYVGDGIDQELPGAAAVGMRPVMIRTPDELPHPLHMALADWHGLRVSSLTEVLTLLN